MSTLNQLQEFRDTLQEVIVKFAFQPPPGMPMGNTAPPGAPPMDPAMMGGAMPPGAPMDPAMAGGAPPMDPAMMGGAMPPGAPMDPAMAGGAPPMDPAMAGGAPPPPEAPQIDPGQLGQVLQELQQALEQVLQITQRNDERVSKMEASMAQTREEFAVVRAMSEMAVSALKEQQPYAEAPGLAQSGGGGMPAQPPAGMV